ncbi:sugar phosphate isomerase/epimerase [Streptacidiphilus sp. MAP12-16]|uniref:sugar phosphate isomerase/epimerase family protein n=1 Tax=Streptacidiphilus sp. MAP12-16 TaxID=3156300 RepID=UPI003511023D
MPIFGDLLRELRKRPVRSSTDHWRIVVELSLITDEVSQEPEEALQLASAYGVRKIAVRSVWGRNIALCDEADVERLAKLFARYGVEVSSVLSPLFKCHPQGAAENGLVDPHFVGLPPVFEQHLGAAAWLGHVAAMLAAPAVRIFTFLDSETSAAGPLSSVELGTISRVIAGWPSQVRAAVENEHVCRVKTLPELEALGQATGLHLVVDPSNHFLATGVDGLQDLTPELLSRTVDVHVKDRAGKRYVPVGEGELQWPQIFERLRTYGYTGSVTLESHLRGDLDGIDRSLRALRRWVTA